MRNFTPIILSICFAIFICIFSVRRFMGKDLWDDAFINFDIIVVSVYLLWMFIESKVARKEITLKGKTSDFGTCELYAIGQALTFLSALWFNSAWAGPNLGHVLGLIIFISGIIYRLWATKTLGKYYSHIVREVDRHQIIDSGPYRMIRHPAYAGMIFAHIGITIYFFNWITVSIFFFILLPAIVLRIFIEERLLFEIDGYSDYARHRKRLIPSIW